MRSTLFACNSNRHNRIDPKFRDSSCPFRQHVLVRELEHPLVRLLKTRTTQVRELARKLVGITKREVARKPRKGLYFQIMLHWIGTVPCTAVFETVYAAAVRVAVKASMSPKTGSGAESYTKRNLSSEGWSGKILTYRLKYC